jgi:protoporphyrinogen/coproporphyrinogen III oxidase
MIVIIGAGITGLALSGELMKRDVPHVVLESSDRPGGVIRSGRIAGTVVEWGPQRTRLTAGVRQLVDELGLHDELLLAPPDLPLLILARGRLRRVPLTLRDLAATDLFSVRAKLRLLLEPLAGAPRPEESVAAYLSRRFGRAAYRDMMGPLFGGLYASDPEDMLCRHGLLPLLRQLGIERAALPALLRRQLTGAGAIHACSFHDGMQTLTDALYQRAREHVRLDTPVREVRLTGGQGAVVVTDRDEIAARHVVLTTSAPVAASLLKATLPALSGSLAALHYNRFAIVHMHAQVDLPAMGYQVALGEPFTTRGVTFNQALFGRAGIYTAFLGGARQPDVVTWGDDRIGALAASEFEGVVGAQAKILDVTRVEIPAWDRSWTAMDDVKVPPTLLLSANYAARAGIPGRLAEAALLARRLGPR